MAEQKLHFSKDPSSALRTAIRQLDIFTSSKSAQFEVDNDGCIRESNETKIQKVIAFAKSYVTPFISSVKNKREVEFERLKRLILEAKNTVLKHSELIESFKKGNDSQKRFAEYALTTLQRYNATVSIVDENFENHYPDNQRQQLLSDPDIRNQTIEVLREPVQRTFLELSQALKVGGVKKYQSKHKHFDQFMIDSFRMKAIGRIKTCVDFQNSLNQVISLIQQTEIDIQASDESEFIHLNQLIQIDSVSSVLFTGSFKRYRQAEGQKIMGLPVLDRDSFKMQIVNLNKV
ncbi:MAG: hypothetical protein Q8K60_02265 [Parachlamydiaceae bacterium]|nr:hypothetical protein [Parachlamydiaceae bacterium]